MGYFLNRRIENIINYDPAKLEDLKETHGKRLESKEFINLQHRMNKLKTAEEICNVISGLYYAAMFIFVILCIFDVVETNGKVTWALILLCICFILLSSKLSADSLKAYNAWASVFQNETIDMKFHNCIYNNNILVCYVSSVSGDKCSVCLVSEDPDSHIIARVLAFPFVCSSEFSEVTLDIEKKCVYIPEGLHLIFKDE